VNFVARLATFHLNIIGSGSLQIYGDVIITEFTKFLASKLHHGEMLNSP